MRAGAALAAACALAAPAIAHDTWIAPESFRVAPGGSLVVVLTSGMAYPHLDHPPEAARLSEAKLRLLGQTADIPERERGEHALRLTAPARAAGLATLWIATKPVALTLEAAEVEEYLREIGATETAGKLWRQRRHPRSWRETYRKHAKTFVQVGSASDASWAEPAGLELEIVPEADPFALRAPARLTVRVLKRGRPLPGFAVATAAQGSERRLVTTDAEGRAGVVLDRPGAWLLAGTEIRPKGEAWESDFTTLTLEVRP
jgi:uncharacterized GH25 family protein